MDDETLVVRQLQALLLVAGLGSMAVAPPARADHEYFVPLVFGLPILVASLVPLVGNTVELADGNGSPYPWTIIGLVHGAGSLAASIWLLNMGAGIEGEQGEPSLGIGTALLVVGVANVVLAGVGMAEYRSRPFAAVEPVRPGPVSWTPVVGYGGGVNKAWTVGVHVGF